MDESKWLKKELIPSNTIFHSVPHIVTPSKINQLCQVISMPLVNYLFGNGRLHLDERNNRNEMGDMYMMQMKCEI